MHQRQAERIGDVLLVERQAQTVRFDLLAGLLPTFDMESEFAGL